MEVAATKSTFPKYPSYKESGDYILGEIPSNWKSNRLKTISLVENSGIWGNDTKSKGRVPMKIPTTGDLSSDGDWYVNAMSIRWVLPYEKNHYKCKYGDIVVVKSSGSAANIISGKAGFVSSELDGQFGFGNFLLRIRPVRLNEKFLFYFLISGTTKSRIEKMVSTTTYPNLKIPEYINALVPIPSHSEQTTIVTFLDEKTTKIDQAITQKEQLISLLKERKQGFIQNALIKGLNQNIELLDSGVDYIGNMPKHWKAKRLKYVLKERNERSATGEETLFMVSQIHGLVVRSEFHSKAEVAETTVGNKIVYENDLVFNKLKAHLGVFFKSTIKEEGLVSPDYAVYSSKGIINDLKYLELLFRHPAYIGQFIIKATGIVEGLIRLYTDDLFSISIPVPPPSEQEEILEAIKNYSVKVDGAISELKKQIEKLKEYKSTLIDSAVTGKIKVS